LSAIRELMDGWTGDFGARLASTIGENAHRLNVENIDALRFPGESVAFKRVSRAVLAAPLGVFSALHVIPPWERQGIAESLRAMKQHEEQLEWLHGRLADEESRRLLAQIIAYRVLGSRRMKMPLNRPQFWRERDAVSGLTTRRDIGSAGMLGAMDEFDLRPIGWPMRMRAHALNIHNTFMLEQYRLARPGAPTVEVRPGDTVIDAGACWGDTSLYFAARAGDGGRVFAYEFVPENLAVLETNLRLNPALAARVTVVAKALWRKDGVSLGYSPEASASEVRLDSNGERVAITGSLDGLVEDMALDQLDFVKMDIEGAEPEALRGAERAIRRFRPRLAICVYHYLHHLWDIPRWIQGLGIGYSLHLGHFTIHKEETVLFAAPAD